MLWEPSDMVSLFAVIAVLPIGYQKSRGDSAQSPLKRFRAQKTLRCKRFALVAHSRSANPKAPELTP
jgi:hypothetical protein